MSQSNLAGIIRKMRVTLTKPITYELPVGDDLFQIDDYIGQSLTLTHSGNIFCLSCGRKTNKSFSQGHCFPCFKSLPQCDMCIMKPETCHYHLGTCRDSEWGEANCMQDHYVYLANSSGLKVGITRGTQIPIRWIDQGASQAVPIFRVKTRLHSGLIESALKQHINDRTDWRKMLKGDAEPMDMIAKKAEVMDMVKDDLTELSKQHPDLKWEALDDDIVELDFPVNEYPTKVASLNFDKTPLISGVLNGIKGQYLILDTGVLNIRKFGGYEISIKTR
ncbi:MAG: DUF2797 domain-containing protein [Gammaproteobacteria bacterium]|nr:DUF2797 domain-containing protein [Gammaproteobacteria bacterium]